MSKIESLQYNTALTITGTIRGSSEKKLYQELGFEYLSSRRYLRKLCLFYKIVVNKSSNYLYNYVSKFINPIKLEAVTISADVLQKRIYCKLFLSVHIQGME